MPLKQRNQTKPMCSMKVFEQTYSISYLFPCIAICIIKCIIMNII